MSMVVDPEDAEFCERASTAIPPSSKLIHRICNFFNETSDNCAIFCHPWACTEYEAGPIWQELDIIDFGSMSETIAVYGTESSHRARDRRPVTV